MTLMATCSRNMNQIRVLLLEVRTGSQSVCHSQGCDVLHHVISSARESTFWFIVTKSLLIFARLAILEIFIGTNGCDCQQILKS